MTAMANEAAETMKNKRSIVNRIKLKFRDLMEDLEQLDNHEGDEHLTVVQHLAEMIEENKLLSRKCRELAHIVKNLKQEKKESLHHSKRTYDVDARRQHEFLAQCEHEKFELRTELERLRKELVDSQSHVELLMAQLVTYKEDFEMERKDRERAVEKIDMLENRLVENNVNLPLQTNVNQVHSGQNHSMPSCSLRCFDRIRHTTDNCTECCNLVLVPRGFGERKGSFEEVSSNLEVDGPNGHFCSKSGTISPAFDGEGRSFEEASRGDRWNGSNNNINKYKRKLNYQDSLEKVFSQKLPTL